MKTGNEHFVADEAELNQYFSVGLFFNTGTETFVDLGACTGDTVERFIVTQNGGFKKIYAFEPGSRQFEALNKRIERLKSEWALEDNKFELIQAGVADRTGTLSFAESESLMSSQIVKNEVGYDSIKVFSLNDFFCDTHISFIKCDIEGAEMDFLQGADKIIKRDKPKMALSVYHRPDDLIEMYRFIKSLVPEYKFKLRIHSSLLMELTLYCYCD